MTDSTEAKQELFDHMDEMSKIYQEVAKEQEKEADEFWENLSEDDREMAFYSVCKRLYQGEIEQHGSYRYVLYDIFGFGPHMYARGMDCGYMALHNCIFDGEELMAMNSVNRLEIIGPTEREYIKYFDGGLDFSLQDNDRTLKIFIEGNYNENQTQFDF
jgi:hypothetical protein